MNSKFATHLSEQRGRGALAGAPHSGAAGGAACGDLMRIAVRLDGGRIAEAGFDARGCGAAEAAGAAVVELIEGEDLLGAATIGADEISEELGGLSPSKRHAADLAADALHRALGAAAGDDEAALVAANSEKRAANRTLVAMSGGVDSAVAAHLALAAGDDVVAVTLELWSDPATDGERSCCSPQAVIGARGLAHRMGIPHLTLDLREPFRASVVADFLAEHRAGRTPNPCVRCNGLVRFDAMLALAERLGADRLVTGHYARITHDEQGPLVSAAADAGKDQSYMLARLEPAALERLWFPLAELEKPAVRELARAAGLPVADKRESQDLCFLAGLGGRAFLERHDGDRVAGEGEIVHADGRVLGRHGGHHRFTVGQRRGLGLASAEPLYVLRTDAHANRVVVGPRGRLETRRVRLGPAALHRGAASVDAVKVRYRSSPVPCRVREQAGAGEHSELELELAQPLAAVAPGQMACLLAGDRVVGWGTIAAARAYEDAPVATEPQQQQRELSHVA